MSHFQKIIAVITILTLGPTLGWSQKVEHEGADVPKAHTENSLPADSQTMSSPELTLRGKVYKNNDHSQIGYNLKISNQDDTIVYQMDGSAATKKGIVADTLDFSGIKVTKTVIDNEKIRRKGYDNTGKIEVWPRKRKTQGDIKLAGVPVGGNFLQGAVNDKIDFSDLWVDGTRSKGCIDYNSMNGRYNAKNDCSFGKCKISSSDPGSICVMNYDRGVIANKNVMRVTMKFDDLILTGQIEYSDQVKTDTTFDGEDFDTSSHVAATTGNFNITVKKADGTPLKVSRFTNAETEDDKKLQKLLAYWELIGFDTSAE